jgi:PAS domain S-box-containing protein
MLAESGKISKLWRSSIRRQLLFSVVVFQVILMSLFVFQLVRTEQIYFHKENESKASSLAKNLAANLKNWIEAGDIPVLSSLVEAQLSFPDLQYAMLIDASGRIMANSDFNSEQQYLSDQYIEKIKVKEPQEIVLLMTEHLIDVAAPVVVNDRILGWARVGLSQKSAHDHLNVIIGNGVLFSTVTILIGTIFAFFITRGIAVYLKQMVGITNGLRQGNYDLRIPITRLDELGGFAKAFNSLAERVKSREAELSDQREHLEEVVLERTRDLVKEVRERQSAEEQVSLILRSAVEGIITADPKGIIKSYNPGAERVFGYTAEEAIGQNLLILMPENHSKNHNEYIERYLETGDAHIMGVGGREVIARRKDGTVFQAELAISELKTRDAHFFTGIVRDITDRKDAEQKLRDTLDALQVTQIELVQAEKMASLGGLVAGIAHEINTPIGVGVTAVSHLQEKTREFEHLFEKAEMRKSDLTKFVVSAGKSTEIISANLHRASDLIKSFKQVAVDQSSEDTRSFNLLGYIDDVLISLHPKLKRTKHHVEVTGDRNLTIESYPGPVAQIVTNLVMNSLLHAYTDEDEGYIKITATVEDSTVRLIYSDDGRGMDSETASKVFEPFYTTRRGEGGSGLGMHIVYNQITQTLGGSVKCTSHKGQGATFEFTFPIKLERKPK